MAGVRAVESPCENIKSPNKLFELCLTNIVNYLQKGKCDKNVLRALPDNVLMDVYNTMLHERRLCILGAELSELHIFERLLRFNGNHLDLLRCFQGVVEHGSKLSEELASSYLNRCNESQGSKDSLIHLGLTLGGFLNEAGWYADAQRVLIRCRDLCQAQPQTTYYKRLTLECCHRLLNTQSAYCCFAAAAETYSLALQLMGISKQVAGDARFTLPESFAVGETRSQGVQTDGDDDGLDNREADGNGAWSLRQALEQMSISEGGGEPRADSLAIGHSRAAALQTDDHWLCPETAWRAPGGSVRRVEAWGSAALLARLCKEFSSLFFVRCDYTLAHAWAMRALRLLTPHTPPKITIDVLRACAKACVVKRKFGAAGAAARQAVAHARRAFGPAHPRYAAALLDYGFYLLNIDSIVHSVRVYEEALGILRGVFGGSSLHVATAQEDLAYAMYVLEYSSGRFYLAREHAELSIKIIENLVPPDHLLLASAKRVKALILEEIALDTPAVGHHGMTTSKPNLLEESESLHKAALALSMLAFGENNVQTAKHYGNLGRLYQSMQKFQDAEAMHLKAIAIKEALLGAEDYEVGLSVGHLASLYNYHMNMHHAAEKLYLRSIDISMKLFGSRYSGLEYDYRGLVHVLTQLKRHEQAEHYSRLLQQWAALREQSRAEPPPPGGEEEMSLEALQASFFPPHD